MNEIKTLVDLYLKSKGMTKVSGRDDDFSPILPLVMMDSANTIWKEAFKTIDAKQELKKIKNAWEKSYHAFNMDYFRCYDIDQTDWITDRMDDYESYIANDVMIAKCAIMDCLPAYESFQRRSNIASLMLVSILTQSANIVWERIFRNAKGARENNYLCSCEHLSHEAMNTYYGKNKPYINCNKDSKVCDAVDILCKKLINYIRTCYENKE